MTREFHITRDLIERGIKNSDEGCPVSHALHAGGVEPICVGFNFIECVEENRRYVLRIPREVFSFMKRHDAGEEVEPLSFKLTFVEPPRPLPDRFRPKNKPKMPPLPAPLNGTSMPTFRRALSRVTSMLSF